MHLLICDDDARFAARVEQKVRDELAQRGIPAQITVCTRGEEAACHPASGALSSGAAGRGP